MPDRAKVRNTGASVRAKLLTLARQKNQQFDLLLTRYAIERMLYRLGISPHRDRFVLKGAMLVTSWFDNPHRATRDVDFLGYGESTAASILSAFRELCAIELEDGLSFDLDGLRAEPIREELAYGGLRLRAKADLAGARISIVIDIGFGDSVEPGVEDINLPVLLDLPKPRLRAYARETVIAEKFHAVVVLGLANTRMKDFYDIWFLSRSYSFDADRLSTAIAATFKRRETVIPIDVPEALTSAFSNDATKRQQWEAFVRDLADVPPLDRVIADLVLFLIPHARRAIARSIDDATRT